MKRSSYCREFALDSGTVAESVENWMSEITKEHSVHVRKIVALEAISTARSIYVIVQVEHSERR